MIQHPRRGDIVRILTSAYWRYAKSDRVRIECGAVGEVVDLAQHPLGGLIVRVAFRAPGATHVVWMGPSALQLIRPSSRARRK